MGIISNIAGKFSEDASMRNAACVEVDALITQTKRAIDECKDFIGIEWAWKVKGECETLQHKIDGISLGKILPKTKLNNKKKELDCLLKRIEQDVHRHNDKIAVSGIGRAREIIGTVEGRQLDDQQMKCIVKPMHNHLVIAGAGTGKTTTIVGKVKYLLNNNLCDAKDILVLSFTKASAEEMKDRINKETKAYIEASTFHKLGKNIIAKVEGIAPKITQIQLQSFVREQLLINMQNKNYLQLLCRYFLNNYKYSKSEFDFQTKSEYEDYLRTNPPVTLAGERVKSYGEVDIANFLLENGIAYQYEKEYEVDTRTENRSQYYPDFYLSEYGFYLEYFGINENGNIPPYFISMDGDPSEEYRQGMEWKRKTHKENNTKLIECYAYERMNGTLISQLSEKLKKAGVEFKPLTTEEIWDQVSNNNAKNVVVGISELMATIISLIKSNFYSFEEFRKLCSQDYNYKRNEIVADLVQPIFDAYESRLAKNDEIDFNDMINKAARLIIEGKYINSFKYVIVDEYQDISKARYSLLKALRDSSTYALFCVGDDWQSIYRFAGSDMNYILNFSKYWGPTEFSKIETTYRFTDSLIEISGNFVMQNPQQIQKSIKGTPSKVGFAMGEIKGYNEQYAIQFLLKRLDELPENSTVYFIGRYSFDSKMLDDCGDIQCKYDNVNERVNVFYSRRNDLKMQFLTAHRSKGLQADYVFIINNKEKGMGFPSKIQDDPVVDLLLEGKESFPFAEERRLFYVALTRAKIKTFIVTINGNESLFATEMERRYEIKLRQEAFSCPLCGGTLVKKNGPYGEFLGCSNYRSNGCKFSRKANKKN